MFNENQWIGRDIRFLDKDMDYKLDLYDQCLLPNESLYRGYIDISLIDGKFSTVNLIKNVMKCQDYELEKLEDHTIPPTHKDLYFLGKICYLTKKYIEDKKFNHPVTIYFNPRLKKHVVHPGIGRMEVYKLLNINSIYCLYFNTGGVRLDSAGIMNHFDFEKITLRSLIEENKPFMLCYTLDHGSLIPQIHFTDLDRESRYDYVNNMRSIIRNLKIKTNVHIDVLEPFINNDNYNVELIFLNSFTELDIARSIIFSIIGHNYQSENLIVKVNPDKEVRYNMLDKDTWVAQNLIPKNIEALNIRRPRLNVKPVDYSNATRKTKFTLCVLGSWAIYMPPYNLARLSSLIRESGYPLKVLDLNVESHYALKDANPDLTDAWNGANYWWWQEDEYYTRIHPTYEPILKEYLEVLLEDNPNIIGFSIYYTNILPTRWMVDEIRKRRPDITIIFGGPECNERNYNFKKSEGVDYYFIGESEQTILDFLNNWENGVKPIESKIGSLYSDTRIDIDSLPYPDYSDFDLQKYWGKNSICAEISRGCIAKCSYCTEVYYWKFRDRGANNVVDELESQVQKYNIGFVSFVDSLMNGNLKEFKRFCEELIERNLGFTWWGYARCDGRMDLEFYQLMANAGCKGFNYGIETGSDKVLLAINKKNTVAEINQNIIDSHKVGMKISACWVIGAPGEDIEAFTHSFNMLWNHRARIMAVSPGPGLGDNYGSAYDDREKFNISPRNKPWLGAWYTLDLTNTRVHRHIRIKLMHMWLYLCKESGGTLSNVHKTGEITDHFAVKFDSDYINDSIEYENFNFNIINSGQGVFADSVMNEVFGFLRMLWRVRGGYEISMKFNKALDHQDFIFAITPDTHSYDADIWFKIDEEGNYQTDFKFNFINVHKNVVPLQGFNYDYKQAGKWTEGKKTPQRKIFYMSSNIPQPVAPIVQKNILPMESCFSSMSIPERKMLLNFAKRLPNNSIVIETNSTLGGRAAIMARANSNIQINSIEEFHDGVLKSQFDSTESWIKQQIVDAATENDMSETKAIEFLTTLENNLRDDANGKEAWKTITGNYPNIQLVENADNWTTPVDFCLIDVHENPRLKTTLDFWNVHIKSQGYIMAHLYDEAMCPDVYREINNLVEQGWKLIRKVDKLVLIQKP